MRVAWCLVLALGWSTLARAESRCGEESAEVDSPWRTHFFGSVEVGGTQGFVPFAFTLPTVATGGVSARFDLGYDCGRFRFSFAGRVAGGQSVTDGYGNQTRYGLAAAGLSVEGRVSDWVTLGAALLVGAEYAAIIENNGGGDGFADGRLYVGLQTGVTVDLAHPRGKIERAPYVRFSGVFAYSLAPWENDIAVGYRF